MNLKSAKGEEYAKSHPPPECDLQQWIAKMNKSSEEHLEMTSSIMEFLKKQSFNGQFRGGGIP
ncbi:unnamed protein product [Camellia sinensis]